MQRPDPFPISYETFLNYFRVADLKAFRQQAALAERSRRQAREVARLTRRHLVTLRSRLVQQAAQRGEALR
jgi:hypothetical protein